MLWGNRPFNSCISGKRKFGPKFLYRPLFRKALKSLTEISVPLDWQEPSAETYAWLHASRQKSLVHWPPPTFSEQVLRAICEAGSQATVLSVCVHACSVAKSGPTLCDPKDCSPPGSSAHGILQARILEWVAISFSRGSSRPRE